MTPTPTVQQCDLLPCPFCRDVPAKDGNVWVHGSQHDEGCLLVGFQLDDEDDVWRWNTRAALNTPAPSTDALAERVYDALPKKDAYEPYYSLTAVRTILETAAIITAPSADAVEQTDCPECEGQGWISGTDTRCCGRSDYECGGRGCTGPEPEQVQEQCGYCHGSGKVEMSGEEMPPFDDATLTPPLPAETEALVERAKAAIFHIESFYVENDNDRRRVKDILDAIQALASYARPASAETEALVERARYRINNPSAWDAYDEGASDLIKELVATIRALAADNERLSSALAEAFRVISHACETGFYVGEGIFERLNAALKDNPNAND